MDEIIRSTVNILDGLDDTNKSFVLSFAEFIKQKQDTEKKPEMKPTLKKFSEE